MTQLLDQICQHYGIQPSYVDIWGRRNELSDETRQNLLADMGVIAVTEQQQEKVLAEIERHEWAIPVPPVVVIVKNRDPHSIPITLPKQKARISLPWSLIEENGQVHAGELIAAAYPEEMRHTLDDVTYIRFNFPLPMPLSLGYHRFILYSTSSIPIEVSIIVAPQQCYRPSALADQQRIWGVALQLYAVRSERNWGIGDFSDLIQVIKFAAKQGADVIGVNPLNVLFPCNVESASPYSPSSRYFLNAIYIDVEAVAEYTECLTAREQVQSEGFQAKLRQLRASELVNYSAVWTAKQQIFEELYRYFCQHHLQANSIRAQAFRRYQQEQGEILYFYGLYETLQKMFSQQDNAIWGWPVWPENYRDPQSSVVKAFALEHLTSIEYYQYQQWLAHQQLEQIARSIDAFELGIGLFRDLPVGVDRGGAEAWLEQSQYALHASIGAPPDDYNPRGQNWGLPPIIPENLRATAYRSFIETLKRNMFAAGALRIDHVMGLMRLFWLPSNTSEEIVGGYVRYPLHDLLAILALESQRNQCLIVGEDLGTVPAEVSVALEGAGVYSYRLLYFEKNTNDKGTRRFAPPQTYPAQAAVFITTHDLPTLAGYWQGRDIDLRRALNLYPAAATYEQHIIERAGDRTALLIALHDEQLLHFDEQNIDNQNNDSQTNNNQITDNALAKQCLSLTATTAMSPQLILAVHQYIARTPSKMMMVNFEDVFGQLWQINMPATIDEYPNWRRKLVVSLEKWPENKMINSIALMLKAERLIKTERLLNTEQLLKTELIEPS